MVVIATELGTAYITVMPSTRGLGKSITRSFAVLPQAADKASKTAGGRIVANVGSAFKRIAAGTLVVGAGLAVGRAFSGAFRAGIQEQKTEKVLKGMYGNLGAAKSTIADIKKLAKDSNIQYDSYLKASQSLAYIGLEGKDATKTMESIGTAITAAGGSGEEMDGVANAMLKMVNQGKVYSSTLNQISDAGYPIFDGLAAHFDTNIENVRSMVKDGKLGIDDVFDVIKNGEGDLQKGNRKAADEVMKSWDGVVGKLKNRFAIALSGPIASMLDSLAPALERVGGAIIGGIERMPQILAAMWPWVKVIVPLFAGWLASVELLNVGLKIQAGALAVHGTAMKIWSTIMAFARSPVRMLRLAMLKLNVAFLANPVGIVLVALVALAAGFVVAYKKVGWFRDMVNSAWEGIKVAAGAVADWFMTNIWPSMVKVWEALSEGATDFYQNHFKPAFDGAKEVVSAMWVKVQPVFQAIWDFIKTYIGPAVLWLVETVFKVYFAYIAVVVKAAWAVISFVFDAIVFVIQHVVAPVVKWLYDVIFKPVFDAIIVVVEAVVNWFKDTFAPSMKSTTEGVGNVFTWLYENIIKPVFDGITAVIKWAWTKIIKPIWDAIIGFVKGYLAPVFELLWAIVKWVFEKIGSWIKQAWNTVIKPVWDAIWKFIKSVLIKWFNNFRNNVKIIWDAVSRIIKSAWNNVIKPIWDAIVSFLENTLGPVFRWLRDNVVKPVWEGIETAISTVWNFIRDKVFDPLKNAVENTVPKAFEAGKDAIGKAWDKVKSIAAKPVKFVVDTVINKGIIGGFNKIADKFDTTPMDTIDLGGLAGYSSGGHTGAGPRFAPKGIVHADEFVVNKPARRKFEKTNPGVLDHINRHGEIPMYGGFAGGGAVWQNLWRINKEKFPNSRKTSDVRNSTTVSGNASLHNKGMAVDVAGPAPGDKKAMMNIFNYWRQNYGSKLAELIHTPAGGKQIKNGQNYKYGGAVAAQHYDHVHIAARKAMDGKGGLPGGGGGAWTDWLNPFNKLFDVIKNKIPGAGAFGDAVAAGGKKIVQMPIDWIKEKASALFDFAGDVGSNVKDVVTTGTGKARGKKWATAQGWPLVGSKRWKALNYIVSRESGWNPKAKNPNSTASGLGQMINSTAKQYLGGFPMSKFPFDEQLAAIVKYTDQRYGGLGKAMDFWKSHNYYASGTNHAQRGLAMVGENGRELVDFGRGGQRVLDNNKTEGLIGGGGRPVVHVEFHGQVDDANDVVSKLQFEMNRFYAGGRYNR